ncbi:spore germination protein KB [Clostridium aceticum]|uniref:Spore germination protein KB n=1 Tax=Clostridium aceticum TaxID=84022 RepID=A0A0D8ICX9_9CLOT|nr:endospore germination permease [Clostridium aceticum]AKL96012.1 spore germination protein KB [Clostridium aceticum]KJF27051.1 hypothetical protein TZ02_09600 [Clostridium aceticum]
MLAGREQISIRQAMFLFLTITFSPAIRLIATYTSQVAKEASWLSPLVSLMIFIPVVLMMQSVYKNYKDISYMEVMNHILGRIMGKIVLVIYMLWTTAIIALYTRYYSERIVSSIFPNVNMSIFIIVMILLVALVLRTGITVIARMNEIILPIIVFIFFALILFTFPSIDVKNLMPVSSDSIWPIAKASMSINAILSYFFIVFFISDKISSKENIKKVGIQTIIFLTITNTILIVSTVGSLGYSITQRIPLPFLIVVKQISLFDILQKLEPVVVVMWISSDFVIIVVFTYIVLQMIKSLFNLSDTKPLINIFLIFIYIFSLYICNSRFELEQFSAKVFTPVNVVLFIILPFLIFAVGKIRKKV